MLLHRMLRRHPLITVVDLASVTPNRDAHAVFYRSDLYVIMCKQFEGTLKYGRSYYDFEEGSLMFTAPGQVVLSDPELKVTEGWGLFFHPDLLAGTPLGSSIHDYTFFQYDSNEALHVSEEENAILLDCLAKIQRECSQNIDHLTATLIADNLQLLLNYCMRYYKRQFYTREKTSNDVVKSFEGLLLSYLSGEALRESGIPDVKYFASQLHLSPNYLSDLLSRFTGKTTQEHIHLQLTEKAKVLLAGSDRTVGEIAFLLGFEHLSHFSKFFKNRTGLSPKDYRSVQ
ncbi:helix-turn-helix domain-containing protein [Flavobacterium rakeshii]|uniref:Helix-turn-helix domain-containing protein n=1 Tax=Flavobacterium rakeshii TaxID=1038845 RepID=A0A6N8HG12_9FLAO|nr:helix-turn-helix domain-containing protein [Flavobacterium rakeshii]